MQGVILVSIEDLVVTPERQRQEFDPAKQAELAESIAARGLLQACGVRRGRILVWGERRVRALKDLWFVGTPLRYGGEALPEGKVPCVDLGDVDELEAEEAELAENIQRADLTWQERAAATARLAALRSRQAQSRGLPLPSVGDLAVEVRGSSEGRYQEETRRELLVARHLDDPEVAGAKDTNDAFKVLKRKEEHARRVTLAAEVGRTYTAETAHRVFNEDATLWLHSAPGETFDVICTDPPYGIGADQFGDSGGHAAGAHFYKDDYGTWKNLIRMLAQEGFRVTKPQAHLYCFCDITRFDEAKEVFADAGWEVFRTPIIWHKPNGNRLPWVESGPQRKWELILYAKKGDKKVTRIYPDLVTYTADENQGHNAQKPVALYLDLLRRSVNPGDTVVDPFAGSGPLLPAAHELKCKATAIELDASAYGICVKRLQKLAEQPELAGL